MTSAPHLDCILHKHNHTHIAATHSTFLSEYPSITFHRAALWCYYTPLFAVYVLTPVGWLYVMPSAINGVVSEWKEKWKKNPVMRLLSLFFIYKNYIFCLFGTIVIFFVYAFVFLKHDGFKKHHGCPFQKQHFLHIMMILIHVNECDFVLTLSKSASRAAGAPVRVKI